MRHKVEIDQSIKIEDKGATILAFANGLAFAIEIPANVKLTGLQMLRDQARKPGVAHRLLFAASLFLLLRDHLDQIERVVIDVEYEGHEAEIGAFLLRFIWRDYPSFEPWRIEFGLVGKSSPAHHKAEAVRRGKDRKYRRITEAELAHLLE
ncbi:MAG: hypothetical protein WA040_13045 [Anaerolineae bacterium]